jgi:hypothetical protein
MSVTEILQELAQLSPEELDLIKNRVSELQAEYGHETPEMLEAIDEGRKSIQGGNTHTIENARLLVDQWTTKSS